MLTAALSTTHNCRMAPVVVFLTFLAALSALVAAWCWYKVAISVDTSGQVVKGPDKRSLAGAATATVFALVLASAAALVAIYVST